MSQPPQQRRKRNYSSMSNNNSNNESSEHHSKLRGGEDDDSSAVATTNDHLTTTQTAVLIQVTCLGGDQPQQNSGESRENHDEEENSSNHRQRRRRISHSSSLSPSSHSNNHNNNNNTPSKTSSTSDDGSSSDDSSETQQQQQRYTCTLISLPSSSSSSSPGATTADSSSSPSKHNNNSPSSPSSSASSTSHHHERYIMLVQPDQKYSLKATNNDALDDYSLSVSVNDELLGEEEVIAIPKDPVILDEYYNGPLEFDNADSTLIVISASSVDSIKKKARVNKRNARYSVVKGEHQIEISIECLTLAPFSERIKEIGYDESQLHPNEQAILSRSSMPSPEDKPSSGARTRRRISASTRALKLKSSPSKATSATTKESPQQQQNAANNGVKKESPSSADTPETKQMKKLQDSVLQPIYDSLMSTEQHLFHNTYYPQLSDQIAFIRDGYLAFWKGIASVSMLRQHIQPLLTNVPPLDNGSGLPDVIFCTVKRIEYRPFSICNDSATVILRTIELFVDDIGSGKASKKHQDLVGTSFKIDYYDHPTTMANYMILRRLYECSMQFAENRLKKGMTIQSSFDKEFHSGKIMTIANRNSSPWECILVRWKDGSESKISAWEIKQIEKQEDLQIPFIEEELAKELQTEIEQIFQNEIIQQLPNYLSRNPNPLSLKTIKERMENRFYRSTDAFLDDLQCVVSSVSRLAIGSDADKTLKWFFDEVDLIISNFYHQEGDDEDYSSDEEDDCNFIEFSFSRFKAEACEDYATTPYARLASSTTTKQVERKFLTQGTEQFTDDNADLALAAE